MKKIGCFVCNFNKRKYVVDCVKSLLQQVYDKSKNQIDIYVIDNASTDDSVEVLQREYKDQIKLVVNAENLGGSGGFNTGLRIALEKNYDYAVLVDNDVKVAPHAIQTMFDYMESHRDVGILGTKILQMNKPNIVQDLGGTITPNMQMEGNYFDRLDENLPEELESDYICTCTAMTRVEAMRKFGLMPEDNFIYWDDVEWSKKCQMAGYKTVAISSATVWHNLSMVDNRLSSFVRYYGTRNRFNYFLKYADEDKLDECIDTILTQMFYMFFGYHNKGFNEMIDVLSYAFDDVLHQVRGKAAPYKLKQIPKKNTPFEQLILKSDNIKIKFMDSFMPDTQFIYVVLNYIIQQMQKTKVHDRLGIDLSNCSYSAEEFLETYNHTAKNGEHDFKMPEVYITSTNEGFDLCLTMCEHVKLVEKNILPEIYVDKFCNCITSDEDYIYFKSFDTNLKFFKSIYRPLAKQAAEKIRAKSDNFLLKE